MISTMMLSILFISSSLIASIASQSSVYTAEYFGELTSNSGTFSRESPGAVYYYQAIQVRVSTTGTYTFTSSSSAIADTYGYLYQGNFYPTYSSYNLITRDDDTGSGNQFQITAEIRSDITYILVFTTYGASATGSFGINASGPGVITLTPMNISA